MSAQTKREVVSGENGEFQIDLPAGEYRVLVDRVGIFDPFDHKKLRVRAGRVKKFNITLKYDTKKHPPII